MRQGTTPGPAGSNAPVPASVTRAYCKARSIILSIRDGQMLRADLARHMTDLAQAGETDERRLCVLALARTLGSDTRPRQTS